MNLAGLCDTQRSGAVAVPIAPACRFWIKPPNAGVRLILAGEPDLLRRRALLAPQVLVAWEGLDVATLCDVLHVTVEDRAALAEEVGDAGIAWSPHNAVAIVASAGALPAELLAHLDPYDG